ncbi:MAG: hypothetical protein IJ235_06325 [Eubacterium sp.]|nr:hypothetical protein [Eubacterium sp.]MBQ8981190.1 hypothetical protein [Eubacterium sp.]MBR1531517.1 hypothetical protein [Eubacterium sp.]MBR2278193.1 hypothetical protein [Eubacterium sp.]
MTLLITIIAAAVATVVWYTNEQRDTYKLGTLSLIYWGASLMWLMDFVFEYAELKADYFVQEFADILNDSLLGLAVVTLGLVAWIVILLIKDPKGVFKKKFTK